MSDPTVGATLRDYGYTQVIDGNISKRAAASSWTKDIRDDDGLRYRIRIDEIATAHLTERPCPPVLEAYVEFRLPNGGASKVTYSVRDDSIIDVEDFFEEIWTHMAMDYEDGSMPEFSIPALEDFAHD